MPIKPELRKFYGREWRSIVRPRILARAGDRCEQCRAPNKKIVIRYDSLPGWWFDIESGAAVRPDGTVETHVRGSEMPANYRLVKIVITVAHLNHRAGDDRDENLCALCQRCHLVYDLGHHRESRSIRKDAERPLLAYMDLISERVN